MECVVRYNNMDLSWNDRRTRQFVTNVGLITSGGPLGPNIMDIAYNQQHQLAVANHVSDFIESKKGNIKLLVVNNLTKSFIQSKNKNYAVITLKEVLGILCKACMKNKVALICTGDANVTSRGIIPRPIGRTFLKHAVNVIVHLREFQYFSFKATLIKHQYVKTPKSAILYTKKTGRMLHID